MFTAPFVAAVILDIPQRRAPRLTAALPTSTGQPTPDGNLHCREAPNKHRKPSQISAQYTSGSAASKEPPSTNRLPIRPKTQPSIKGMCASRACDTSVEVRPNRKGQHQVGLTGGLCFDSNGGHRCVSVAPPQKRSGYVHRRTAVNIKVPWVPSGRL